MDSVTVGSPPIRGFRSSASLLGRRLHYALYFADIGFIALSAAALYLARDLGAGATTLAQYSLTVLLVIASFSFFGFQSGLYDWRQLRQQLRNPTAAFNGLVFAFGVLLLLGFAFKVTAGFSRLWVGFWFTSIAAFILISRLGLAWHLSRPLNRGLLARQAVIIGAGENGQDVLDHVLRFDNHGVSVTGFLDDRTTRVPDAYQGTAILGPVSRLEDLVKTRQLDLVIIALPSRARERINGLLKQLSSWSVDVYLAPDKVRLDHADRPVYRVAGMHVLSLKDRPISDWSALVKRIEDLLIAVPAVILLSPLLALTALAIRIESKGKALFVQERYGFNNNLIRVYKFRSMYTDMEDRHCKQQTTKDDPRVTRVGRFIRKTSLDELPQLFNVIQGNMSIVGPRPHASGTKAAGQLLEDVVAEYASRHRVKPGITGWAQCNGWRGETDTREKIERRVEHDLYYIENWSVFLDLLVILKTLLLLFKREKNAY